MATKDLLEVTVENTKEELLAEIRPIGRAVDKDSIAIIDHERRIHRLEKQMA